MGVTLLDARLVVFTALAWGSACGGNVVVDATPDGSGGAGATSTSAVGVGANSTSAVSVSTTGVSAVGVGVTSTGAGGVGVTSTGAGGVGVTSTSGSWMTSAAVTTTSTGAGGGDAWSTCVSYCKLVEDRCGITQGDGCGDACDDFLDVAPTCNHLLVPLFECAMRHVDVCEVFPDRCQEHLDRFNECTRRPGCSPLACSDSGRDRCHCKGSCNSSEVSAQCRPSMPTGVVCSCFINNREVARCEDIGPACNLAEDCCGPFFDAIK